MTSTKRQRFDRNALVAAVLLLALLPLAFGGSSYYMRLITLMLVYAIYTVAFNIVFGYTRQLFLCIGALAGLSAYVSVILTHHLGWPPWLTAPLGVAAAGLTGALFSYVAVRRGLGIIFVGIVTLVFSMIFQNLLFGLRELTNGETGLETRGIAPAFLAEALPSYYFILAVLALALLLQYLLLRSRTGQAFRAISDDDFAAELAGIDVVRYKVLAATIGSCLLGIAGVVFAYQSGFISPAVYSFVSVDIVVLVSLLLGGMGTLLGPVFGAVLFTLLDEIVRPFGHLNVLLYGIFIVVLVITFRHGIAALLDRLFRLRG